MDLTADAVSKIAELAAQAAGPVGERIPNGPKNWYLKRKTTPDGVEYYPVAVPTGPRRRYFLDLRSLVEFAADESQCAAAQIWHSWTAVYVLCNYEDGQEWGKWGFAYSPQFLEFAPLNDDGAKRWRTQADFVRFLRIRLAGCLADAGTLLQRMRSIRWEAAREGTGTVKHQESRMGRAIRSKVGATDDLPEEVVVTVPVYDVPGLARPAAIRCALEIDVNAESFRLTPYPMEFIVAREAAAREAHEAIEKEVAAVGGVEIDVLFGWPSTELLEARPQDLRL